MNIVLIGKSASGKSTMEKLLTENFRYERVISTTTRPKRAGETDGVEYHFLDDAKFLNDKDSNKFLETTTYRDWHYGIAKKDIEGLENAVVCTDPVGIKNLKKLNYDAVYILIKTDDKTRYIRQLLRGDDIVEVALRSERDKACFQGIEDDVDYVVTNDVEEWNCVDQILRAIANKLEVEK